MPNLNYQQCVWLNSQPGDSVLQVFQVPACHTHTHRLVIRGNRPHSYLNRRVGHWFFENDPVTYSSRCLLSPSPSAPCAEEMATEQPVGPTQEQLEILEYNFSKVNKHPDPTTLCLIAAEAGLSEEQTLKWFKQRLAEWRKSEGLPSESGSVRD
ncbi:homeodomain-only protein isoform X1 [Mauremys mutica]|uniref:Homeodomain-only protein n=2 Tax=Mauremys mutica TaxID=74926 RepID=A0A9D3WWP9_9SAUR|nr:homeodomain-only protein isoform X1 [Mauremys mutica]KAH1169537.1 hypothetical protein KIL84_000522 [Mauremys mutica]